MKQAILITGACGGIGRELCRTFKDAGYFVIASDRVSETVDCDAFVRADLMDLCVDRRLLNEFVTEVKEYLNDRGLFTLINNAAIQILGSTESITIQDWRQTLDINLTAPFLLVQ